VSQRDRIPLEETGEIIAKTSPDQLVANGIIGDGAVVSFQIRGGMNRGTAFLFEIHGDQGDLQLTAISRASMQRQELNLRGARGDEKELAALPIPSKYRWIPEGCRPTLVTMSLSSTRDWPKASETANLPALDLILPSLVIG
jgi:hypothetical protein